jgi:hypothetical protein
MLRQEDLEFKANLGKIVSSHQPGLHSNSLPQKNNNEGREGRKKEREGRKEKKEQERKARFRA